MIESKTKTDKKSRIAWIPSAITSIRIVGTLWLIWIAPLTKLFYIVYTLSGLTDVLDGAVARLTKTCSEFGSKLDSVADLLFYTIMMLKIMPTLLQCLPGEIWYWVAVVMLLRIVSYTLAYVKKKEFSSLHTICNKITGFFMFLVPYTINKSYFFWYCIVLCTVATIAAIQELLLHSGMLTSKKSFSIEQDML